MNKAGGQFIKASDIQGWDAFARSFPTESARTSKQREVISDLSRVNSRFKFATGLRKVHLDGFTARTMRAYTQLMRVELAVGATEMFCLFLHKHFRCDLVWGSGKMSPAKIGEHYARAGRLDSSRMESVRKADPSRALLRHLVDEVNLNDWLKGETPKFFDGQDDRFICLATAIRHVFTHGSLSADAGGLGPAKASRVYHLVSEGILDCLAAEFRTRSPTFTQLLLAP